MLNIPIVHKEVFQDTSLKLSCFEQIEYKQIIEKLWWRNKQEITTVIEKSSDNGKFKIIIKNVPFTYQSFVVSLNNYISPNFSNELRKDVTISSENLKGTLFKDVSTIAIAINAKVSIMDIYVPNRRDEEVGKWTRISELNIKIRKDEPSNKSFLINQDGLLIETYSAISFIQDMNKVTIKNVKSKIKIIPNKIVSGKHNIEMFHIKNISKTEPPLIVAKTIEGLKINNSSKNNKAIFKKSSSSEDSINDIIGHIYFSENTYYDLKDENTHSGIGANSKNGYIVPYNFKGNLIPILNIDIDSIYNILIGFSNPIKNAYFDKSDGLIKLTINESNNLYDESYEPQNKISNFNFSTLISNNLSLADIIKLEKRV